MPLFWDLNGALVPPGRVAQTFEWWAASGALPSWLTVTSGTPTFTGPSTSRGLLSIATGAVSGNTAQIKAFNTGGIGLANFVGIRWEVFGARVDSVNVQYAMGIAGSGSVGGYIRQNSNPAELTVSTNMAGNLRGEYLDIRAETENIATHKRNLGLFLLPASVLPGIGAELYAMEDDQVMVYRQSAINLGSVSPDLTITTQEAVAHTLEITGLRLTLFHN